MPKSVAGMPLFRNLGEAFFHGHQAVQGGKSIDLVVGFPKFLLGTLICIWETIFSQITQLQIPEMIELLFGVSKNQTSMKSCV